MKKIILTLIFIMALSASLIGCGSSNAYKSTGKLQVVTTIFPEYDWVRHIVGDDNPNVELSLLLDNGADLHSYQPTAEDILKISTCDLFIYVGGESDEWVDDALEQAVNKDMIVLNLLDLVGDNVKEEELKEGMESEEHEHEHAEETEYDEHVWLSLQNSIVICNEIANALANIDSDNADLYKANASTYTDKLKSLDSEYEDVVAASPVKTLLFGDRFPFRYMTDDYGLDYFAAFVGCSAETEASFETIMFLANKVDELSLKYVLTIENSDGKIANTVIENTKEKNAKVLSLNSMQTITAKDIENGVSYLGIMEDNLEVVKAALS